MTRNTEKNPKDTPVAPAPRRAGRGFAGMDPGRQRQIAAEGGRAAHVSGNAHQFTREEAREAGRKGGAARAASSQRRGTAPDPAGDLESSKGQPSKG